MRRHQDRMKVDILADPFKLGDPADINRVTFDQFLEVLAQIDLFAEMDRRRAGTGQLTIDAGIDPWRVVAGEQGLDPEQLGRG
ncbi:hypothetical protein KQ933_25825 (plasmid) [Rhizobium sp. WYJ-E13]|nr:hypothetical protein [Rhizobium sp. WYJ-E13]QWW72026.1 hypothetical protein KQ933_25825 [Rhizobium sp. WYJ-E13]